MVTLRVGDLSRDEFRSRLEGAGIGVVIGPFPVQIQARAKGLVDPIQHLYRDFPVLDLDRVFAIHLLLEEKRRSLGFSRRLVRFSVDGVVPHEDLPAEQALAVLEWGINLVIALRFHTFLMLHSAVVERYGKALLLPAWPGHGKTTLCTALVHRGWRLLSDEFGLLRRGTSDLVPIPRPMPLKNESIGVIRNFAPEAELGPEIPNTRKGTVAHVKPPSSSVIRANELASPGWIVFPRWVKDAPLILEQVGGAETFMMLATNAFNYDTLGEEAYKSVRELVDGATSFRMVYSDLEEALTAIHALAEGDGTGERQAS
jgi:HprK-related kinase A